MSHSKFQKGEYARCEFINLYIDIRVDSLGAYEMEEISVKWHIIYHYLVNIAYPC